MKKWEIVEIDNTEFYLESLECETKPFKFITYYIDDNVNHWSLNPVFSLLYYNDEADALGELNAVKRIDHDNDIEILNQLHDALVEQYLYGVY